MSVRVVVVDHRPTTRAVLRQLFETWGWDVVGEATDANEALAAARTSGPDLIVCDPSGGDPDLANLPTLVEPLGAPAVVSIVDFPHELAASRGRAVLKGVPTEHLRAIFLDALAARAAAQDGEPSEAPPVQDSPAAPEPEVATERDAEASLTGDSAEERRRAARALLAEPATAERAARAGQAVTDPDREVRQLALHALEDNPRLAPAAALEAAAVDPDPGVRARALRLLGRAGHAAHASLLASHVAADFEEPLRRAALSALIDLTGRAGADMDQASVASVVRAFGMADPELFEQLEQDLGRAALSLGVARVEAYSSDPRPEVAAGAARLVEAAGRVPVPPTPPKAPAARAAPATWPWPPPSDVVPPEAVPSDARDAGESEGDPLARVLSDPRADTRLAAIEALEPPLGPAEAVVLDNVVRSDTSVPVVLAAARALAGAPAPARLQAAEACLAHPSQEVRLAGVDLVPADDDGSILLVRLLSDPDFAIVSASAAAFERFPSAEVLVMIWPVLRTLDRRTVDLLIEKLIFADRPMTTRLARNASHSPDAADRALGLRVLVALGAESVGDRLERALADPARQVRRTAVEAFRDHPALVSVEAVGPRIHDPDVEVRRLTVETLAAAGDDRALIYLLEAARDPVAEVRIPAREHLLLRCLTPSARMLVSALGVANLRTVAAELLAHAPERTAELIAQALPEADIETRAAMARVLSTSAAVELLSSVLASPDPERRRVALRGLALAQEEASAPAVIACVEDPEADIRRDACILLGQLKDPAATAALRRVLVGDPDMEVVAAAETALRRLTEVEPGETPSEGGAEVDLSDSGRSTTDNDAERC